MTEHPDEFEPEGAPYPAGAAPEEAGDVPDDLPDGPSALDLFHLQRERAYIRGRIYRVFIPGIFNCARRGDRNCELPTNVVEADFKLELRVFGGWRDREDGRWPVFVTEHEWHEIRLQEETAKLRAEGHRSPEQWMTLKEIAAEVGKDVRTIRRHIVERGECPFTAFGRTKKVRRSDFEEWTRKDRHETREIREADSYRKCDF